MPSNFTEHYHLSQWEKSDKVLMDDFNADNAKLDAALTKCGNCRVRVSTYVGDGELTRTHTFDRKPVLMILSGVSTYLMLFPEQSSVTVETFRPWGVSCTWEENSVTVTNDSSSSASSACNIKDRIYHIIYFEDASED